MSALFSCCLKSYKDVDVNRQKVLIEFSIILKLLRWGTGETEIFPLRKMLTCFFWNVKIIFWLRRDGWVVESGGLENRWVSQLRGFESYSLRQENQWNWFSPVANSIFIYQNQGEMAELAEGARLLSECGGKLPPRVRIPVSPPL